MENLNLLKERIIEAVRILTNEGLIKTAGHVSVRVGKTDRFLITGHVHEAGKSMTDIGPGDLVLLYLNGRKIEGHAEAPGEVFMHNCIYGARRDAMAVIHIHPFYSTALSVAGKHVLPLITTGVIFAPQVPIYNDPNHVNNEQRGQALAKSLGDNPAVVIRGHGAVVVGRSLEQAVAVAVILEDNARTQFVASSIGELEAISLTEVDKELSVGISSEEFAHSVWAFYAGRAGGSQG